MVKTLNFLMITAGLILLFHFAGLTTQCGEDGLCEGQTPNSDLLNLLLGIEQIGIRDLFSFTDQGFLLLEGLAAASILVGAIVFRNPELALAGTFSIFFFNLVVDIVYVFNVVAETNIFIALILFGPVLLAIVPTFVEWWRGVTT